MTNQGHEESREERRLRAGLSKAELARRSGIAPDTVRAILNGKLGQDTKVRAVDDALDEALSRRRFTPDVVVADDEAEGLVEYRIGGPDGFSVVVSGPIADRDELEASALRLVREMNKPQD